MAKILCLPQKYLSDCFHLIHWWKWMFTCLLIRDVSSWLRMLAGADACNDFFLFICFIIFPCKKCITVPLHSYRAFHYSISQYTISFYSLCTWHYGLVVLKNVSVTLLTLMFSFPISCHCRSQHKAHLRKPVPLPFLSTSQISVLQGKLQWSYKASKPWITLISWHRKGQNPLA